MTTNQGGNQGQNQGQNQPPNQAPTPPQQGLSPDQWDQQLNQGQNQPQDQNASTFQPQQFQAQPQQQPQQQGGQQDSSPQDRNWRQLEQARDAANQQAEQMRQAAAFNAARAAGVDPTQGVGQILVNDFLSKLGNQAPLAETFNQYLGSVGYTPNQDTQQMAPTNFMQQLQQQADALRGATQPAQQQQSEQERIRKMEQEGDLMGGMEAKLRNQLQGIGREDLM